MITASPRRNPHHPFLPESLDSIADAQDTLTRCAAVLSLLADLFGGETEKYTILDSDEARHGMFIQLFGLADTLRAVRDLLEEGSINN